jgi:hypothetical protein
MEQDSGDVQSTPEKANRLTLRGGHPDVDFCRHLWRWENGDERKDALVAFPVHLHSLITLFLEEAKVSKPKHRSIFLGNLATECSSKLLRFGKELLFPSNLLQVL